MCDMGIRISNNLYYSAYSYLDEWMREDRHFHQVLAFEKANEIPAAKGIECLVKVAKYYKVIRTLKTTEENFRLEAAYEALLAIEPLNKEDVVRKVENFAEVLGKVYGSIALSAASKFLWMRFRSPVIIYDSIASGWLCKNCNYNYDGYSNYHQIWSSKYREYEEHIREACAELKYIKKFTLACEIPDKELSEWTISQWFMERVFDHFMLNDSSGK